MYNDYIIHFSRKTLRYTYFENQFADKNYHQMHSKN